MMMESRGKRNGRIFQTLLVCFMLYINSMKQAGASCDNSACATVGFFFTQSGPSVVWDYALLGHTFQNLTTSDARGCFQKCASDCRCVSFNYVIGRELDSCQLNDENRNLKPSDLKATPGSNYYDLVIDYSIKDSKTSSECKNRCCMSCSYCQNGGTCHEICKEGGLRFTCSCTGEYTGKYCETKIWKTCHEVRAQGFTTSGVYLLSPESSLPLRSSYCDFDSENGSSWTLIESFSLENKNGAHNHSFYSHQSIRNQKHPNWDDYRVSHRRGVLFQKLSTHWRATCNFDKDGVVYTDYLLARMADNNLYEDPIHVNGSCAMYKSINIRGKSCVNCTALTFHNDHFHIDSYHSADRCEFNGTAGAVVGEDNFGSYLVTNPSFRCSAFDNSTTQFWVGTL